MNPTRTKQLTLGQFTSAGVVKHFVRSKTKSYRKKH